MQNVRPVTRPGSAPVKGDATVQPSSSSSSPYYTPLPFDHSALAFVDALPWPAMLIADNGHVYHLNPPLKARGDEGASPVGAEFARHYPHYHSALGGKTPWLTSRNSCAIVTGPQGEQRFEELSLCRLATGACLIIMDQTERWKLETCNVQTTRLASLGFMLASVSHEVRNPLTAIHSMVQVLQSQNDTLTGAWKDGLRNIAANVRSLLNISRKLTMFSRTDQEPQAPFSVDFAIEEAILLFGYDSLGETVQVTHDRKPQAIVYGLPGQLQQVVYNLLLNAAQAMKGQGSIFISTALRENNIVDISIRDTGPGIPPQHLTDIFEPFFTTKRSGEGTGLGLALSNEIVHEHGGHIEAENHPSGGACFHLLLPLVKEP